MEKEFVPCEESLALKELGFDEECLGLFHKDTTWYQTPCKSHEHFNGQICSAPLWQQAFRWFREKHDIQCYVDHWCRDAKIREYHYSIEYSKNGARHATSSVAEQQYNMLNYDEAQLACLRKLIEIAKENVE